jgi:ABC-2 type transport system ATP-binding protein
MSAINVHGLTKRFGDVLAVDGLGFEVEEGTVVGFLGPNGAGKTTTLRMLLGLVTPTAGTATFGGRAYRELPAPTRAVGAVLEASGFHPGRSARNHLRVLATAAGLPWRRVDEVLGQVGLAEAANRRVGGFSLGMRQRLGLAAALLGDPAVLLLDEPARRAPASSTSPATPCCRASSTATPTERRLRLTDVRPDRLQGSRGLGNAPRCRS